MVDEKFFKYFIKPEVDFKKINAEHESIILKLFHDNNLNTTKNFIVVQKVIKYFLTVMKYQGDS